MIKDISKIREYLEGYVEVELPYEFEKNSSIQYITCEYDKEGNISCDSFFPNCKFIRRCNDILIIESNTLIKRVPMYKRDKEGNIIYQSRFFIREEVDESKECEMLQKDFTVQLSNSAIIVSFFLFFFSI